jgi:hypothetical protein
MAVGPGWVFWGSKCTTPPAHSRGCLVETGTEPLPRPHSPIPCVSRTGPASSLLLQTVEVVHGPREVACCAFGALPRLTFGRSLAVPAG